MHLSHRRSQMESTENQQAIDSSPSSNIGKFDSKGQPVLEGM